MQYLAYGVVFHGGFSFQPWYYVVQPLLAALLAAAAMDWVWNRMGAGGFACHAIEQGEDRAVRRARRHL